MHHAEELDDRIVTPERAVGDGVGDAGTRRHQALFAAVLDLLDLGGEIDVAQSPEDRRIGPEILLVGQIRRVSQFLAAEVLHRIVGERGLCPFDQVEQEMGDRDLARLQQRHPEAEARVVDIPPEYVAVRPTPQGQKLFQRIKRFRRIALRCEKTVSSFMGFVFLVSALDWLR